MIENGDEMANLYTRTSKCPTCGARVERNHTDIFFPYCGYSCKRVVQRKAEERERARIARDIERQEERLRKIKEKEEQEKLKKQREADIDLIRKRLEKCQQKYDLYSEEANRLPKGCSKRRGAVLNASVWASKLTKARNALRMIEEESDSNGACGCADPDVD